MAAAAAEVQSLLRFLTQDAKVPLSAALPKIGDLRKAKLNNAESISKASLHETQSIFHDDKLAKQVLNAAKRITNPKKRSQSGVASPNSKRLKTVDQRPDSTESALELPMSNAAAEELAKVTIETNRAPLVLAFAVMLTKYTMPEQPLSSRLSMAQAVVSLNSQSKAKSIGIINEKTAEDEGWAQGQPKVKVLGREIPVMRRATVDYPFEDDSQATVKDESVEQSTNNQHEAFWGLDLEELRKSNTPLIPRTNAPRSSKLPIHAPQAARTYLLKSFAIVESEVEEPKQKYDETKKVAKKKPSAVELMAKREEAVGMLLKSLDLLYESWITKMTWAELDRKAWSWYIHIRPEIAQGQAGWGQRGHIKLADILKFRKTP